MRGQEWYRDRGLLEKLVQRLIEASIPDRAFVARQRDQRQQSEPPSLEQLPKSETKIGHHSRCNFLTLLTETMR